MEKKIKPTKNGVWFGDKYFVTATEVKWLSTAKDKLGIVTMTKILKALSEATD